MKIYKDKEIRFMLSPSITVVLALATLSMYSGRGGASADGDREMFLVQTGGSVALRTRIGGD